MSTTIVASERTQGAWWVVFEAKNEGEPTKNFSGKVLHVHIHDPGAWDDIVQQIISTAGDMIPGPVGTVLTAIQWTWEAAKNSDGTYELYSVAGVGRVQRRLLWWTWWVNHPILFLAFVSDRWWLPPVGLAFPWVGPILPVTPHSIVTAARIRWLDGMFRGRPTPP